MTLLEEFSKGLEGKELNKLIREAKAESENRILGQGIAYFALFISGVIVEAMMASDRKGLRHFMPMFAEYQPTPVQVS